MFEGIFGIFPYKKRLAKVGGILAVRAFYEGALRQVRLYNGCA